MRHYFVLMHRYVGLLLAGFIVLSGVTGALLAFKHELDGLLNAKMAHVSPPASGAQPLDPFALRDIVLAHYPDARINRIELELVPGEAMSFRLDWPKAMGERNDEVFIHPYTGQILGERKWGDITQGMHNLMPFLFRLHQSLTMDRPGIVVLGIVALLWTLDCFVGAYLTFPAHRISHKQGQSNSWLQRWGHAWKVRWGSSPAKVHFDLHRVTGLWPWLLLLVFAWSSVGFNLREVYWPVMRVAFSQQDPQSSIPKLGKPQIQPNITHHQAWEIGRKLMAEEAGRKGFIVLHEVNISYDPARSVYRYRVKSDRDVREEGGSTSLWFDANSGARKAVFIPTGEADGDTVTTWLYVLHMASIGGVAYKLFISLIGLTVALLSITGVVIWHKKRKARRHGMHLNQQLK